jgi:hypothetical protein
MTETQNYHTVKVDEENVKNPQHNVNYVPSGLQREAGIERAGGVCPCPWGIALPCTSSTEQ